eukprot:Em0007g21a
MSSGNDEVKRGVLLMLFGGIPKTTVERTRLRGDINVCIVGDPSTGQEPAAQVSTMVQPQLNPSLTFPYPSSTSSYLIPLSLLPSRQVELFSPRAVYTSGKVSTAAGLTAAVGEGGGVSRSLSLRLEPLCWLIMPIHEAMEQQTISITKAGVKATLNARTSILAAANPGGWEQNLNMGAPIMSRFDLFFILVDDCNEVTDYAIARRIVDLHCRQQESIDRVYSMEDVQRYLLFARQFKPKISDESAQYIVDQYRRLRQRDCGVTKSSWRITVRQLESMIRLSEAMARMYCSEEVHPRHVKEAFRLLSKSIIRVETPDINFDEPDLLTDGIATDTVTEGEPMEGAPPPTKAPPPPVGVPTGKQIRVTYEEYKSIANLLVLHLRQLEESSADGESGVKRMDLVDWYLEANEADMETIDEVREKRLLVERVIERLVQHDHVLLPLVTEEGGTEDSNPMSDLVLDLNEDLVCTWEIRLPDGIHTVTFEHGSTSGKRVITVDGVEVLRKNWLFKLVGTERFNVGSKVAEIAIDSSGMIFQYTLRIDNKSMQKFVEAQAKNTRTWHVTLDATEHRVVLRT